MVKSQRGSKPGLNLLQLIQGQMTNFSAFIAWKHVDLSKRHMFQIKHQIMGNIKMYKSYTWSFWRTTYQYSRLIVYQVVIKSSHLQPVGKARNVLLLKMSQNKKDLNDVTAAPFLVSFSQLPAAIKTPKTGQLWRH